MRRLAVSTLLLAMSQAWALVFEDNFDAGVSPYWHFSETPIGLYTQDYSGGRVAFSKGNIGPGSSRIAYSISLDDFGGPLAGDFKIEIDADSIVVPQGGINQVELRTYSDNVLFVNSYSNEGYATSGLHVWDGHWRGGFETTVGQGRFRIQRQGGIIGAYFSDQLVWSKSDETQYTTIDFQVQNFTGNAAIGARFDNFRLETSSPQITGVLYLSETISPFAVARPITYLVKQGTATIASGTLTALTSSRPLWINLAASVNGSATLVLDGSSFLRRSVDMTVANGNASVGAITLSNGDVDHSGEVDAADIDDVIAHFGVVYPGGSGNGDTDADCSGEVDAADIDLVIGNFGLTDE